MLPRCSVGKESACSAGDPVQSLGQKDPLEKGMGTHSRILAWRIPWPGEPGGLQSTGSQRVGHDFPNKSPLDVHLAPGKSSSVARSWSHTQCLALHRHCISLTSKALRMSLIQVGASLMAQTVKYLPAVQETGLDPCFGKIPLEEGMVTHSSVLAWRIPWTEEPGGLQSTGSDMTEN